MKTQQKRQELLRSGAPVPGEQPAISLSRQAGNQSRSRRHDTYQQFDDDFLDSASVSSVSGAQTAGEDRHKVNKKSGMLLRASEKVEEPQLWPHVALKGEFMTKNVAFHELDFKSFVAGELEIITSPHVEEVEREGRLHLLKEIVYLSRGYSWDVLRNVYASILSKVEVRMLSWAQWSSQFLHQIQWALIRQQMDAKSEKSQSRTKASTKVPKQGESDDNFFCKDFNRDTCSKGESHSGMYKGRKVTMKHFCARCWIVDRVRRSHSERDVICPAITRDQS